MKSRISLWSKRRVSMRSIWSSLNHISAAKSYYYIIHTHTNSHTPCKIKSVTGEPFSNKQINCYTLRLHTNTPTQNHIYRLMCSSCIKLQHSFVLELNNDVEASITKQSYLNNCWSSFSQTNLSDLQTWVCLYSFTLNMFTFRNLIHMITGWKPQWRHLQLMQQILCLLI